MLDHGGDAEGAGGEPRVPGLSGDLQATQAYHAVRRGSPRQEIAVELRVAYVSEIRDTLLTADCFLGSDNLNKLKMVILKSALVLKVLIQN